MHYALDPISGEFLACFGARNLDSDSDRPFTMPITDCSTPQVEMKITKDAGLGLFAEVDIKQGTRIMEDAEAIPLFRCVDAHGGLHFNLPVPDPRHAQLHGLARAQHEVNQLHERILRRSPKVTRDAQLWQYIQASLLTVDTTDAFPAGIFPTISRINHCCMPDCQAQFARKEKTAAVIAAKDIEAGAELNIAYINPFDFHPDVAFEALSEVYGFICRCTCCTGADRESRNKGRFAIKRLANDINFLLCQRSGTEFGRFDSALDSVKGKMLLGPLPATMTSDGGNDHKIWMAMLKLKHLLDVDGISLINTAAALLSTLLFRKRPSPNYKTICYVISVLADLPLPKFISEYNDPPGLARNIKTYPYARPKN